MTAAPRRERVRAWIEAHPGRALADVATALRIPLTTLKRHVGDLARAHVIRRDAGKLYPVARPDPDTPTLVPYGGPVGAEVRRHDCARLDACEFAWSCEHGTEHGRCPHACRFYAEKARPVVVRIRSSAEPDAVVF